MPKNTFPNVPTPSSSSSRYSFTEHNTHEIRSRRALGARRFLSDGRRTVALILFGLCVSQQCHQSRNLRHKIRRRRLCPLEQSRRQQAERRNSPLLQQGPRTKRTENVTNALSTDDDQRWCRDGWRMQRSSLCGRSRPGGIRLRGNRPGCLHVRCTNRQQSRRQRHSAH